MADTVTASSNPAILEGDSPIATEVVTALSSDHCNQDSGAALSSAAEIRESGDAGTPYHTLSEHFSHYGGESEMGALRTKNNALEEQYAPIYGMPIIYSIFVNKSDRHKFGADSRPLGDPRGVALVAEICEPQRKDNSGHILVPRIFPSNIDPETLNYLRLKGVFDLPSEEISDMMIQKYFSYVHPFFPVIEVNSFIDNLENARHKLSIHLLWSIFMAAANVSVSFIATLKYVK